MGLFDGYGDSSSFGGLGSGFNNFLSNPLVLASLQMMSNNSPRVGQPVNTFDNVAQVLSASTAAQRKNQEQDLSQNAIASALEQAGFSKEDANKFKYNPAAANIVLDQLKQRKMEAASRDYLKPDTESDTSERPTAAPLSPTAQQVDPLTQQLKINEQVAAPYTSQAAPAAKTMEEADKFVSSVNPGMPDYLRSALSKMTADSGTDWANHPMGEAIKAGDYVKAKELLPDYIAQLDAKSKEPLPKQEAAEPQDQPSLAPSEWGPEQPAQQPPARTMEQRGPAQPAQQPPARTMEQRGPTTDARMSPVQQSAPQLGWASSATAPTPPQTVPAAPTPQEMSVTQRALAAREAARQATIQKQMKKEEAFLANPNASPGLKEVSKLRLQNLQKEMEATPDMREYRYYVEQQNAIKGPVEPFTDWLQKKKQPLVNIDQKQETKYSQEMGKHLADTNMEIVKDAQKARGKIATLNQLESLLKAPNLYVGKGGTLTAEASAWAKAIGVDVGNAPAAQAIQSISNQFALELRNPSGGAGMPGAMSDPDRNFLMKLPPGLDKTPEGNALLADYMRRKEERSLDVERLRQRYVKKNGKLDEGFFTELSDWSDAHPLFTEEDMITASKIAATAPGAAAAAPPASARNGTGGTIRWERGPDGVPRRVQ